jgi:hypothetical protein
MTIQKSATFCPQQKRPSTFHIEWLAVQVILSIKFDGPNAGSLNMDEQDAQDKAPGLHPIHPVHPR